MSVSSSIKKTAQKYDEGLIAKTHVYDKFMYKRETILQCNCLFLLGNTSLAVGWIQFLVSFLYNICVGRNVHIYNIFYVVTVSLLLSLTV